MNREQIIGIMTLSTIAAVAGAAITLYADRPHGDPAARIVAACARQFPPGSQDETACQVALLNSYRDRAVARAAQDAGVQ